jgi:hypothetical protein
VGLLDVARADVRRILNDTSVAGPGVAGTLTDPSGATSPLTGIPNDIASQIDPDLGVPVAGRTISFAGALDDLPVGTRPRSIQSTDSAPWLLAYANTTGAAVVTYKVIETRPDEVAGSFVMFLDTYG